MSTVISVLLQDLGLIMRTCKYIKESQEWSLSKQSDKGLKLCYVLHQNRVLRYDNFFTHIYSQAKLHIWA